MFHETQCLCVLLQWWVNEEKKVGRLGKKRGALWRCYNEVLGKETWESVLPFLLFPQHTTFPQENSLSSFQQVNEKPNERSSTGEEKQTVRVPVGIPVCNQPIFILTEQVFTLSLFLREWTKVCTKCSAKVILLNYKGSITLSSALEEEWSIYSTNC